MVLFIKECGKCGRINHRQHVRLSASFPLMTFPTPFPNDSKNCSSYEICYWVPCHILMCKIEHFDTSISSLPFVSSERVVKGLGYLSVCCETIEEVVSVAIPILNRCHFFSQCCGKLKVIFYLFPLLFSNATKWLKMVYSGKNP